MPAQPFPLFLSSRRRWLAQAGWGAVACVAAPASGAARRGAAPPRYPLAPRQHFWLPHLSPSGPVVALVNLHTQMIQVFRDGVAIGFSSVSTGKAGHGTPPGVYPVLQKARHHRSSTYNNAPMPYMLRLTWPGVALHGGHLPGYPASHGCIRLPHAFAARVFETLRLGDLVMVVRHALPSGASPITLLAPITAQAAPMLPAGALTARNFWRAAPPAPGVPLTLLASLPQQRLHVLQAGALLAACNLPPVAPGTAPEGNGLCLWQADGERAAWRAEGDASTEALAARWWLASGEVAQRLRPHLAAGSRLLISALPAINDVHRGLAGAAG
ncbi:L,D-transpeptidase family protein [Ottowia testudinis]|uniref:L,D-transpeptidase family protein n=1 Tax=Ottowia testudinis TaxID=2816950 RepID=A0A975CMK2_9BURK|nr:L,D-transpeptidase family protein [Ottowia testudinis]QTD46243.1 L,D-transpeptidase family protein [Ottowia testudinis]